MKRIVNWSIHKNEFVKNTFVLSVGTSFSQVIPLIAYPILSRMFSPAEFGLFANITAITAIITVFASGKFELGVLIAEDNSEAVNIISLVLILSGFILTLVLIGLFIWSDHIALWLNEPKIASWLYMAPISALSIVIFKLYNEWCVRNKDFRTLAFYKVTNSSSTTIGKIFFGLVPIPVVGLIVGDTLGRIVSAIGGVIRFLKNDRAELNKVSLLKIKLILKKYKDFPKFSLPETLLDTINSNLIIFAITPYFLSTEAGYFSMANAALSIPTSVISLAVMDVFRQKANEEWQKNGNCLSIYLKTVRILTVIILPLSLGAYFLLPVLFSVLLGENWKIAGEYAQIMLPNIAILFIFQVVSAVFIIANKMKVSFQWQILSISLTIVSLYFGCVVFNDMRMTLILYVIARIIANLFRFYLTYKYAKN